MTPAICVLVQVVNSSHVSRHNREESYRCFVYQQRHNGYLLSQSAGANCNLYTATEGYRTMTLTKCEILFIFQTYLSHFRYVQSTLTISMSVREEEHSCQFPSWLTEHRRYHSLGGRTSYSTNPAATVLSIHKVISFYLTTFIWSFGNAFYLFPITSSLLYHDASTWSSSFLVITFLTILQN